MKWNVIHSFSIPSVPALRMVHIPAVCPRACRQLSQGHIESQTTTCTRIHFYNQFRVPNLHRMYVFGLWEEACGWSLWMSENFGCWAKQFRSDWDVHMKRLWWLNCGFNLTSRSTSTSQNKTTIHNTERSNIFLSHRPLVLFWTSAGTFLEYRQICDQSGS